MTLAFRHYVTNLLPGPKSAEPEPFIRKVDRRRRVNPTPATVANPPPKARCADIEWPERGFCVWPLWGNDPGRERRTFCAAKVTPGRPYCAEHVAKAYRRPDEIDR